MELHERDENGSIKAVCAILMAPSKKIFISQRSKKDKDFFGYWEFPGGKVDLGENLNESLLRELREEVNLQPEEITSVRLLSSEIEKGKNDTYMVYIYLIHVTGEQVKNEEGCRYQWVTVAESLHLQMIENNYPLLNQLLEE